jgi:hypothetical protein
MSIETSFYFISLYACVCVPRTLPSFETASLCVCVICIYPGSSRRVGRKSDEYTKNRKNREQRTKGKGRRKLEGDW